MMDDSLADVNPVKLPSLITMAIGGSLRIGDVITFDFVPYYPWYKWLWYHLRYMRHTNPMFKKKELRQFVVTGWGNEVSYELDLSPDNGDSW